jgi:hypothetical protein
VNTTRRGGRAIVRPWLLIGSLALLGACTSRGPGGVAPAAQPDSDAFAGTGARSAGPVSLGARYVAAAAPSDHALLEGSGEAVAAPDAVGEVATTFRAQVVAVHVARGDVVRAGDAVVDVRAPDLVEAAVRLVASEASVRVVASRVGRLRQLHAEGLVEALALYEAEARAAELRSARAAAAATLRGAGIDPARAASVARRGLVTLRAPVGGVVSVLRATPGEVRDGGGEPYARIVGGRAARLEVRLAVPPPAGAGFVGETRGGSRIELGDRPLATLVAPADGSTMLWLPLPDEVTLAPGERVRVHVRLDPRADEPVSQVPLRALRPVPGTAWEARRALVHRRVGGRGEDVPVVVLSTSGTTALVRGLAVGDEVLADVSALLPPADEGEGAP